MYKHFALALTALVASNAFAQAEPDSKELSYQLGVVVGASMTEQLRTFGLEIKVEDLARGFGDGFGQTRESEAVAKANTALQAFRQQIREQQGKEALARGQAFLTDNGKRDEVTTTESGLQYEVLDEGSGENPKASDTVTVHYRGTLIDGTEFDSSFSRGEPATFQLNGVIMGWIEGVQLMKVGAKYRFFIPAELAYGERGAGANIGPNETLIFDVQLLEIGG